MSKRSAFDELDGNAAQRPRPRSEAGSDAGSDHDQQFQIVYDRHGRGSDSSNYDSDSDYEWPCHEEGTNARSLGLNLWIAQHARERLDQFQCPMRDSVAKQVRRRVV